MYDIIIVGGGPAGMTAALYAARNGKKAIVIESGGFGGQITHSPRVENYPSVMSMSGNEFAENLLEQIVEQGADIECAAVAQVNKNGDVWEARLDDGGIICGRSVILATGVKHRMLGLQDEQRFIGEGISFCAVCDGDFYAGKTVCVAGGGNSALQEAILLSSKCKEVIILQDLPCLTGEQKLQEVLKSRDNVRILTNVKIESIYEKDSVFAGLNVQEKEKQEKTLIACDGLFVAIGLIPENESFAHLAVLNNWGYFDSDEQCLTRTPGVFVAGDCRSKGVRQLTTAVADGATAALAACRYLDNH